MQTSNASSYGEIFRALFKAGFFRGVRRRFSKESIETTKFGGLARLQNFGGHSSAVSKLIKKMFILYSVQRS